MCVLVLVEVFNTVINVLYVCDSNTVNLEKNFYGL